MTPTFPTARPRRLRHHPLVRELVRETALSPRDLILPLFVRPGRGVRKEIASMPGNYQLSVDTLVESVGLALDVGIAVAQRNRRQLAILFLLSRPTAVPGEGFDFQIVAEDDAHSIHDGEQRQPAGVDLGRRLTQGLEVDLNFLTFERNALRRFVELRLHGLVRLAPLLHQDGQLAMAPFAVVVMTGRAQASASKVTSAQGS